MVSGYEIGRPVKLLINTQRLGTNFAIELVKAGKILIRQHGTSIYPSHIVSKGKGDTLFAITEDLC